MNDRASLKAIGDALGAAMLDRFSGVRVCDDDGDDEYSCPVFACILDGTLQVWRCIQAHACVLVCNVHVHAPLCVRHRHQFACTHTWLCVWQLHDMKRTNTRVHLPGQAAQPDDSGRCRKSPAQLAVLRDHNSFRSLQHLSFRCMVHDWSILDSLLFQLTHDALPALESISLQAVEFTYDCVSIPLLAHLVPQLKSLAIGGELGHVMARCCDQIGALTALTRLALESHNTMCTGNHEPPPPCAARSHGSRRSRACATSSLPACTTRTVWPRSAHSRT